MQLPILAALFQIFFIPFAAMADDLNTAQAFAFRSIEAPPYLSPRLTEKRYWWLTPPRAVASPDSTVICRLCGGAIAIAGSWFSAFRQLILVIKSQGLRQRLRTSAR